jgi:hypothetical protein
MQEHGEDAANLSSGTSGTRVSELVLLVNDGMSFRKGRANWMVISKSPSSN